MSTKAGVYKTAKKDGSVYYRASLTFRNKHISLGSYSNQVLANKAYEQASLIVRDGLFSVQDYQESMPLSFQKFITLVNFRDNGIYFKTPIYIHSAYFEYYLTPDTILKFDRDDLFFYATHKIMQRGGYLFVCDYGSQYGILTRYGIKSFAVANRDYIFANGDPLDYRYENIKIINHYTGVQKTQHGYTALIHINGNYIIGRYPCETDAAIAYNKAADHLKKLGISKNYIKNYIVGMSKEDYQANYNAIKISKKIINYAPQ